ncbi:MAG: hypothetical protein S4CHLAM20_10960 [Chlamydiia bacterium]|nr:hypothetical protein [Chlamydiia bacterium]
MNNKTILQLEGAALFLLTLFSYHTQGFSWWLFAYYFLVPDAALIGYSINNKLGALLYNIFHTKTCPILLYAFAYIQEVPLLTPIAMIWFCHINFDRMLGIGLKEIKGFKFTHLGKIG